ncbi:MAG: MGDG synthase family glycosyltransferase [Endomicrobiales bacterium]
MCRILFLYATNNSGHQKSAEAIQKSLHQLEPRVKTHEIDFFTSRYPTLGPFIFRMYLEIMRSIPHTWDYLYDNPNLATLTAELRQVFNFLNIPRLHQVLDEYRPDAIVCTQAIPAGFIATEKEKGRLSMPMFVTITDFVANPYWPDSQVDGYFVPDQKIKNQLMQRAIPANRIEVTGIPIDHSFALGTPKAEARRKLDLRANAPTVLVMGGSQGLGQIPEAVDVLSKMGRNIQVIVVTGNNRDLCRCLRKKYFGSRGILVLGYVRNMARIMDASDILVSKPGGLTSAEAMAKGLAMIILSPLPGQEERNAAYLLSRGVAERCNGIADLQRIVESFLVHPQKLRRLQSQALAMGRPYASRTIAIHLIRSLFREYRLEEDGAFPAYPS